MDVVTTRLITQRKPAPPAVPAVPADVVPTVVGAKPQKSTTTTTSTDTSNISDDIISDSGMNDKFQGVSATITTSTPTHYDGLWDCVTRITKEEGLQAFFIGR